VGQKRPNIISPRRRATDIGHTFANNLYHIVYSTKGRRRALKPDVRARLFPYIGGIARNAGGSAVSVGGVEDHVHMLVRIDPDVAVSNFLSKLKSNSSRWIAQEFPAIAWFGWQSGYACFTVSESRAHDVMTYIEKQETRHADMVYEEELSYLLRRHKVAFDREAFLD